MVKCGDILKFMGMYWKSMVIVITPLIGLPIVLCDNYSATRCAYVVFVMAIYWMLEVLPLGITGLMPVFLFPVLGIMDSGKTCMAYMKETCVMFLAGIFIAIAVEHCNLHTRIALVTMKIIGCSPKRLCCGTMLVTCFISMWIVNTAATAMMIPIIQAILLELEAQGLGSMYQPRAEDDPNTGIDIHVDESRKPTKMTMCMYISTAYAANVGGIGTLVGTGTNLTYKGIHEASFPEDKTGISFLKFMSVGMPSAILTIIVEIIWLEFYYLGLFRPKSQDAIACSIGKEGEQVAKNVIKTKLKELGPMSFHEIMVAIFFVLCVLLWILRKPEVFPGWADVVSTLKTRDSAVPVLATLLMFAIPSQPNFIYYFSEDEEKRPKKISTGLITWKVLNNKMPWGLLFLLGGGFAISDAARETGMGAMVAEALSFIDNWPPIPVLLVISFLSLVLTNFISSNVAVCNIIMPVVTDLVMLIRINPIYVMLPTTLVISMAMMLPISTPPNAIAGEPCNMSSVEMMKIGSGAAVLAWVVIIGYFLAVGAPTWGSMNGLKEYPQWAADA